MFAMSGWTVIDSVAGRDDHVYIRCPDGEGGDFPKDDVLLVLNAVKLVGEVDLLERYFWENF